MTEEDAESIIMASKVGMFHGKRSELATALLIIAVRDQIQAWKEEAEP